MISSALISSLRCPQCRVGGFDDHDSLLTCKHCKTKFPFSQHRPILLRHDNALFSIDDYVQATPDLGNMKQGLKRFVPSPSVNLAYARVVGLLRGMLDEQGVQNILVVGGGKQRKWLDPMLKSIYSHNVVYSDIDTGADVDLFCDGHDLPFDSNVFDAVITTAVLEHVLLPERVADEIYRILKSGGFLYSEMPFMQQVHEGAYDFTRYTLSGHRRLFNGFSEIESGMVAGPGTALVWAIENFLLAFVTKKYLRLSIKILSRLVFSWIKYADQLLVDKPQAMDGASCTYFFGKKVKDKISDAEIISRYVGAKHLQHV